MYDCRSFILLGLKKQLDMIITDVIKQGKPFLGVCLGMQLLLENSEEGNENCLGILSGKVRELPNSMKIPHMGWNQVKILRDNLLFKNIPQHSFFYFVHSFYSDPNQNEVVSGITDYGIEFCSALSFGNVNAVQFHPEKSGLTGLKIYENFLRYFVKG